MHNLFITLYLLCFHCAVILAQDGVCFRKLTLDEALDCAKAENKLVFVDCYTSWCGPCRVMANEVFPRKEVGDFMNTRLVSIKVDMEKGEGPAIRQRFGVQSFPTFLILKPDGTLWHRMVGRDTPRQFVARLQDAFTLEKSLGSMDGRYSEGERGKDFLTAYLQMLINGADSRAGKVAGELFRVLDDADRLSVKYRFLYTDGRLSPHESQIFRYWADHCEAFAVGEGEEAVDSLIAERVAERVNKILALEDTTATEADAKLLISDADKTLLRGDSSFVARLEIVRAVVTGCQDLILDACCRMEHNIGIRDFPFSLVFVPRESLSLGQLDRWINLCNKVINRDPRQVEAFRPLMEQLEKCRRKSDGGI